MAQQNWTRLVLDKPGKRNRIEYEIGDQIILKQKYDKEEFKGTITNLYDSILVLGDVFIKLEEVDYIKTEHTGGFLSPSNGPKLIIAGVGLLLIDQLNNTWRPNNDFAIPKGVVITSGCLVGFGIFWTTLRYRKFHPGKNRWIRIIE